MAKAQLLYRDGGRAFLSGVLDFDTVADLRSSGAKLLARQPRVVIDLRGVSGCNSAGLALLVEWMRHARRHGTYLAYARMPEQMLALVRLTGLDAVLGAVGRPRRS